jgi:ribosome-binding ATPase YchF (GTP1/OBG family)
VRDHLNAGRFVRSLLAQNDDESRWLREMHLLSGKAVMYVCNVPEKDLTGESECVRVVREIAAGVSARTVRICASIEAEIATLPAAERGNFMRDLGLSESGLSQVIREGYDLLHLLTFFTVGSKEVRAWTLPRGATAIDAAGVIHTDFAKGFIRAEVMKFEDFSRLGSEQAVKDAGVLRLEGKEYQVRDGDIVHFRFNV